MCKWVTYIVGKLDFFALWDNVGLLVVNTFNGSFDTLTLLYCEGTVNTYEIRYFLRFSCAFVPCDE